MHHVKHIFLEFSLFFFVLLKKKTATTITTIIITTITTITIKKQSVLDWLLLSFYQATYSTSLDIQYKQHRPMKEFRQCYIRRRRILLLGTRAVFAVPLHLWSRPSSFSQRKLFHNWNTPTKPICFSFSYDPPSIYVLVFSISLLFCIHYTI